MDDQRLLDVRDLKVSFTTDDGLVKAVDGITFHIDRGETLAIVGESGSGKSVTALAIMGLIASPPGQIAGGEVYFRGKNGKACNLVDLPEKDMRRIRGNDIAMIFQEPMTSLNPVYTVGDQIAETIRLHQNKNRGEAGELAVDMLDMLGIPEPRRRMDNYPHQLSGGMSQRVMIAMALSCNPSLLIADEPTTALDVTIQAQILDLIRRLQGDLGMAVLFITHDLGVVAEMADRVIVMYAGRSVEEAGVGAIFGAPRMPYTRALLDSIPLLGHDYPPGEGLKAIPGNVPDPLRLPRGCSFHPRCGDFNPGLCDQSLPPLETTGPGNRVRCLRWRELAGAAAR